MLASRGLIGAVMVAVLVAIALVRPASKDPIARDIDHGLSAAGGPVSEEGSAPPLPGGQRQPDRRAVQLRPERFPLLVLGLLHRVCRAP